MNFRQITIKDIPNILTLTRIVLIPIFVLLLINPSRFMVQAAIVVFIIAAITDFVDGALARWCNVSTDFGKLLDPLADKILVMTALVMLVSQRSAGYPAACSGPWVPGWMVVMVLAREIWVTGLRGIAAANGRVVSADNTGKWKSALQMVAIVFLLMHENTVRIIGMKISGEILGYNLLLLSIVFGYWGAIGYTRQVLALLAGKESVGPRAV